MADGADDRITLECACGARLRVPRSMVGKKGKCPKCANILEIPGAGPPPLPPISDDDAYGVADQDLYGVSQQDDPASLLDELAALEKSQPTKVSASGPHAAALCPQCDKSVASDAVMCIACGFNLKSGKATKAASARRAEMGSATRKLASGAGTFLLGCVLSGAGALVGAIVWAVVCISTNYEIGYIAWGLGVLAGLGMWIGYKGANLRAGLAAVAISLIGIVAAKGIVFGYVNYPELTDAEHYLASMSDELSENRERIAIHRARLQFIASGRGPAKEEVVRQYENAYAELVDLSADELGVEIEKIEAWEAGEKWSDQQYVHDFIVFMWLKDDFDEWLLDKPEEERDEYYFGDVDREVWRTWRKEAVEEVDAMSVEEQLVEARDIEHDQTREKQAERLAVHERSVRALTTPPSQVEESLAKYYEERTKYYKTAPDDRVEEAIASLDAWEKGEKWDDVEYVRNSMIAARIEDAISRRDDDVTEAEGNWDSKDEEWAEMHDEAAGAVDEMSHEECRSILRSKEEEAEQRIKELVQSVRQHYADEAAGEYAGELFDFFVENYFDAFDLLFVFLAVGSAYKIAVGGLQGEED